ncbi:MAG: GMC family oxidoreductase [Acidobacteriota bacterium]
MAVLGSGAGGSLVASELAHAGLSVIVLEKGRHVRHEDMTQREFEMSARLLTDDLYHPAEGNGTRIPILRGECLGGSSVIADAICHDPPESLLASWAKRGLASYDPSRPEIAEHLAAVKRAQSIGSVRPETVNVNNRIFRLALERSGYSGRLVERNLPDGTCRQSGFCFQGCLYGDKQSALNTYVPAGVAKGATFLTECIVDRIEQPERRGMLRVLAKSSDRSLGGPADAADPIVVSLTARRVVLAAGAIETPRILLRSGAPFDVDGLSGSGLSMHYQTFVLGWLPGVKVRAFEGLPVSYECDEFARWRDGGKPRVDTATGFWFHAAFSHPWNFSTTFRFYGQDALEMMEHYDEIAGIMVYVTSASRGRVRADKVSFDIGTDDQRTLRVATQIGAGLLFKAGARKVWTAARPAVLEKPEDLRLLREGPGYLSRDAFLYTTHPMGGATMGAAGSSVCDEDGQVHGVPGLYVADASAFPTPIGAPPYVTVMLHARKVAMAMLGKKAA